MHTEPTHPSYSKVMEVACLLSCTPSEVKYICRDIGMTVLEAFEIFNAIENTGIRINYYVQPNLSVAVDPRDFASMRAEAAAYYDEVYNDA